MIDHEEIDRQARKYLDLALGGNARMYESGLAAIGYFDAPASSGHHLAVRGGLVRHSVNVTRRLAALTDAWGLYWPRRESPYIVGMFHDLVKCRCYRAVPCAAQTEPQKYEYTQLEYPGHGTCSVAIAAELGIHLLREEIVAITFHMGTWGIGKEYSREEFWAAERVFAPHIIATHNADWYAAEVDEGEEEV